MTMAGQKNEKDWNGVPGFSQTIMLVNDVRLDYGGSRGTLGEVASRLLDALVEAGWTPPAISPGSTASGADSRG